MHIEAVVIAPCFSPQAPTLRINIRTEKLGAVSFPVLIHSEQFPRLQGCIKNHERGSQAEPQPCALPPPFSAAYLMPLVQSQWAWKLSWGCSSTSLPSGGAVWVSQTDTIPSVSPLSRYLPDLHTTEPAKTFVPNQHNASIQFVHERQNAHTSMCVVVRRAV